MRLIVGDRQTGRSTALFDWAWSTAIEGETEVGVIVNSDYGLGPAFDLAEHVLQANYIKGRYRLDTTLRRGISHLFFSDENCERAVVRVFTWEELRLVPHKITLVATLGCDSDVDSTDIARIEREHSLMVPIGATVHLAPMRLTIVDIESETVPVLGAESLDGMTPIEGFELQRGARLVDPNGSRR